MTILDWLFNPSGLTAHGFCLSWAPGLVGLHVVSDAIVGLSYFSIPLAIAAFIHRRPDIRYGWVAYLFVAFILACGATHFFSIFTLWVPAYGVEGVVKALTAVLSIATAVLLWPLIPKAAALPSAAELEGLNARLVQVLAEKTAAHQALEASEAAVRAANAELEARVAERTAELTAANAELQGALEQRDLLLREVYHRVKNNLQIVDSLLVMQARAVRDEDAKAALMGLRSRVYALGLVHHQLMGSPDLKTFDFAPFLEELSGNIVEGAARRDIALTVKAQPLTVGLDFAIPLGLLVTELVTNCLKHAFPDGQGEIAVELSRADDGAVSLVVADNGQGSKGAAEAKPESKAGGAGLGSSIIKGLVAQLRGAMTVDASNGMRSEIRVAAPILT